MLFIYLLTTLAGLIAGAALAHHLGYQAGGPLSPGMGWQALALTGGLGLLARELAIAVFGERATPQGQPRASAGHPSR